MSVRGTIGAFAAICGVMGSLVFPEVSNAQLAEQATAATINGQLRSAPGSNGIGAAQRARGMASQANQLRQDDNRAWNQTTGTGQTQQGSTHDLARSFKTQHAKRGTRYTVDGTVLGDEVVRGTRIVLVMRGKAGGGFEVFGLRPQDESLPKFANGSPVRATAIYAAKVKEPKSGKDVYGFDEAVFEQSQVTAGQPMQNGQSTQSQAPAPAPDEPRTFDSVMKGWVFRGLARVEGKATGVFVKEEAVKYAQAGTMLEDGVKVTGFKRDLAVVRVDGKPLDVAPW